MSVSKISLVTLLLAIFIITSAAAQSIATQSIAAQNGPAVPRNDSTIIGHKTLDPIPVTRDTKNEQCTECHGVEGFAVPLGEDGFTEKRHLSLDIEVFTASVHGEQKCVECHTDIEQLPHREDLQRAVDCVECHAEIWREIQGGAEKLREAGRLGVLIESTEHYMASVHALPRKDDPTKPNATCTDCHNAHYVFPMESKEGQTFRMTSHKTCGRCHEEQLQDYSDSVHGLAVDRYAKKDSAVCVDCHTMLSHDVSTPETDTTKLLITRNCGGCHKHEEQGKSYRETYHGQVASLGWTHTAKCFDCHAHHKTSRIDDPVSKVHRNNRLETCQTCHKEAPEGFVEFHPHGTTHDIHKYPYMWMAAKFMIALLIGVFAFFWAHSALWFYREWKDRKEEAHHVVVNGQGDAVPVPGKTGDDKHILRFTWPWRVTHLLLAIAVMVLVLTGTTVLYADSFWASTVMTLLGGPKVVAIIHRIGAITFGAIFFGHILYTLYSTLIVHRKTFRWFGPYSLLPRWQDFRDFRDMVRWFLGKGPRPVFDHWTYFEKFDYWAPFWGMFIIGVSGLMLSFPETTASFLPGWIFNVATIVHGEEAFLAAVFLFTVHYFNCHWRPSKLPQDIVMFTGTVPLEEFKHERKTEYDRLVANGELEKYLVDPPSQRMTRYSRLLGATLIALGLILLTLVLIGFGQQVLFH
uniref:Cytochrome b subunit of formate dehydrogenase n=1 Tax=Candidatus Kentrum sp. MB TaxID=2138164 RepID=A0A450XL52_9GAMM|nr:MAG: Cytochrome b subunit of formate dehydrogenase [Candidatus Kentron sp. MB]